MLVLGNEACSNGLGTSLLKRLHGLYNGISGTSESNPYTGKKFMLCMALNCSIIVKCRRD